MNCPECNSPMIRAKATSFGEEYDYCRSCKKELSEIRFHIKKRTGFIPPSTQEIYPVAQGLAAWLPTPKTIVYPNHITIHKVNIADYVEVRNMLDLYIVVSIDRQRDLLHLRLNSSAPIFVRQALDCTLVATAAP